MHMTVDSAFGVFKCLLLEDFTALQLYVIYQCCNAVCDWWYCSLCCQLSLRWTL